jgi:hypothetical protein
MIMQDQSRRLREPLSWGRRERTAVLALLACLAVAVIGLGVYALSSGAPARRDCVAITFASTLGAAELHACGAQARHICASPAAYHGAEADLRVACEHAGFPFKTG